MKEKELVKYYEKIIDRYIDKNYKLSLENKELKSKINKLESNNNSLNIQVSCDGDHNWNFITSSPGLQDNSYVTYRCSKCGKYKEVLE